MTSQMPFDTNCMTLTRFLISEQRRCRGTGEFSTLLNALQTAIKSVSSAVRKAGMTNLFGAANSVNVQGEDVKRLDVLSNELFINMLKSSYSTFMLISEENEDVITIEADKAGKYLVAFDPLDGSSNIDCLASIGSIFAIYRQDPSTVADNKPELVVGENIVAAGYALYGSATMIVLAVNKQVNGFMLDPEIGEFILTDPNMKIPSRGKIYSVNEGYCAKWDQAMINYVNSRKFSSKSYSSRYIGSMVADVHRTLKYGGIFMYPKMSDAPNGKLRLLYESNPMAYIFETAGGLAMSSPNKRILEIKPTKVHDRCPVFLGSSEDVEEIMAEYTKLNLS